METEKKEYAFSEELVKTEANNIYEMFERDYNSFESSKMRSIAHCDRKLRHVSDDSQRILWEAVKKEIIKNF
jgi:hypothetical protein